jgi:hypothetical protein
MTVDSAARWSDRFVAALLAVCGVALIITSFVWFTPKPAELVEVREHLASFHAKHYSNRPWWPGESKTWYSTVFKTEEGGIYYTDALNEEVVREALQSSGAALRFYIASRPHHTLAEGAQPSYGLWVDGREIQSIESALASEHGMVRVGFPLLGLGLIALGFFGFWRRTRATPSSNQALQPTAGRFDV